jgi:aminoglycoside 2'-N-acetyltransferase I
LNLEITVVPTVALTAQMQQAIIDVCNRAFADQPGHDFTNLFDFVTDSMHVIASRDGVIVGHACWATRLLEPVGAPPLRTAYVDAVATEPELQGRGVGTAVMERFAGEAAGYELNALSTDDAVPFYEKLGWERWLGPAAARTPQELTPTPNDIVMILRTPSTPALDLTARIIADYRGGQPW